MIAMPSDTALVFTRECFLAGNASWDKWIENPSKDELAIKDCVLVDADNPLETFDSLSAAEKDTLDSVFESDASSPESEDNRLFPSHLPSRFTHNKWEIQKKTKATLQMFEELENLRATTLKLV